MAQEQLYKAFVQSGLKHMSYAEFSGLTACVVDAFLSNQNFLYVGESDKLFLLIDLTS